MMILYLDVYFLLNLWMDLLILDLAVYFLKLSADRRRLLAAAAAGAAAAAVSAAAGWSSWQLRCISAAAGLFLMEWTAFGRSRPEEMLRRAAVLFASGMLISGCLGIFMLRGMKTWVVVLWGTLVSICIRLVWKIQKRCHERSRLYCTVLLEHHGKTTQVRAILDTGNRLYAPFSHEPVHVITADPLRKICSSVSRIIYIPYCSVGRECGTLPAVRIDRMQIRMDQEELVEYEHPWLAISPHPLSPGHQYEMLVHLEKS